MPHGVRRPGRLPLRAFLFGSLSVATLAPIGYLGPTQVARWRDVQRESADKELRMAAESLARTVGLSLDGNVRDLTSMANQLGIFGDLAPGRLQLVLHEFRQSFPLCYGVNVSDSDARPIVSDPPAVIRVQYRDRAYYQAMLATGRTAVSDVEIGRLTGVPSIHMAAPIFSTSATDTGARKMLGAAVNSIGLGYLQEVTSKSVEMFGDMEARVLDRSGHLVVDSRTDGLPPLADLSKAALYAGVAPGPASLRGGWNERGQPVRAALARVPEQGLEWTVAVMRPEGAIDEQARRARMSTLIAFVGALGLGVVFSYLLSSWLAQPISRLARYTRRVADGKDATAPTAAAADPREVTDLVATVTAMVAQLRKQADLIREREKEQVIVARFRQELEIAERIQTGVLPKAFDVPGFELGALMKPAEEVGGDYYELLPSRSGFWAAVGDVSGHGLTAGLVMLMLQSALAAVAIHCPEARPAEILGAVNRLLVENIRRRLGGDDHVTLVLLHIEHDGTFSFSGGHEPLLILRREGTICETHEVEGPWMGIRSDLDGYMENVPGKLEPGDLLILHSDGIVEAGVSKRELFGLPRLCAAIERLRAEPASVICREVVMEATNWAKGPAEDDMTLVVIRRREDGVTPTNG